MTVTMPPRTSSQISTKADQDVKKEASGNLSQHEITRERQSDSEAENLQ